MVGGINTLKVTLSGNNAYSLYLSGISNGYIDIMNCSFDGTTYEIPMFVLEEGVYGQTANIIDTESQLSFSTTGAVNIEEGQDFETGYYSYYFVITGDCTIIIS